MTADVYVDAHWQGYLDGAAGVAPVSDHAEYRRFYVYGRLAREQDERDRAGAFEPSIDYPTRPRPAPSIPRPAPATATDVVLAAVCLIGVFGFGMALAAGLVSIAERLAVAP